MGMFEPWHIIIIFIFFAGLFGLVCALIGDKRGIGRTPGFFLGLLLGVIGLIIVLCSPSNATLNPFESIPDQLKKYKDLLDSGAITQAEYELQKTRLLNQK